MMMQRVTSRIYSGQRGSRVFASRVSRAISQHNNIFAPLKTRSTLKISRQLTSLSPGAHTRTPTPLLPAGPLRVLSARCGHTQLHKLGSTGARFFSEKGGAHDSKSTTTSHHPSSPTPVQAPAAMSSQGIVSRHVFSSAGARLRSLRANLSSKFLSVGSKISAPILAFPSLTSAFAQDTPNFTAQSATSLIGGAAASTIVMGGIGILGLILSGSYKRCPANKVMVVSGAFTKGGSICIHGGGRIVFPVIQEYDFLNLEPLQIDVSLKEALSFENIRVNVPSVFTVAISPDPVDVKFAAQRLLGLTRDEIAHQAKDIIFGQLRQVIAGMEIEAINRKRNVFVDQVKENIEHELKKVGLELINVNITDITDQSGYLHSLGQKATAEANQKASVIVAEQEKLKEIGVAIQNQIKSTEVAETSRKKEVSEALSNFLKLAEIKDQEREMRIKVAFANANAVEGENKAKESIALSNATLKIKQVEANLQSESKDKESQAKIKEIEARAMTMAAIETGKRIEAETRATLEAPAKAEKARVIVNAEARREEMLIHASGEAEAILLQKQAESKGQLEILKSKAEGMRMMVEAAGGSKEAFQLLMLDHIDHLASTASNAISNIKFDKVVVWDGGAGEGAKSGENGGNATGNFLRGLTQALPPTMHLMKDIAGVEMPKYFGSLVGEDTSDLVEIRNNIAKLKQQESNLRQEGKSQEAEQLRLKRVQLISELQDKILKFGERE